MPRRASSRPRCATSVRASSGPSAASARCGRSTRTTSPTSTARGPQADGDGAVPRPEAESMRDEREDLPGFAHPERGGLHGVSPPDRRADRGRPPTDLCTPPPDAGACGRLGAPQRCGYPVAMPRPAPLVRARPRPASSPPSSRWPSACPRQPARPAAPAQASPTGIDRRAGHTGARPSETLLPDDRRRRALRGRRARRPASRSTLIPVPDGAEVLLSSAAPVDGTDLTEVSLNLRTAQDTAGLLDAVRAPLARGRASSRTPRPRPSPAWPRSPRSPAATAPSCSSSASSTVTTSAPSPSAGGSAQRRRRLPA